MMFKGGKAHYRHTLHMSENPQKSIQNCRVFAGETSHFAVNRFRLVGGGNEPPGEAKVRAKRQRCEKKKPFGVSTLYKSSAPKEGTLLRNSETLGKELNV